MKHLLLLRHAQALPATGGNDIDRVLSPKGMDDARALGKTLRQRGITPDQIICSAATRTRQTCEKLLEGLNTEVHTTFTRSIYDATPGDLFQIIQTADSAAKTLLLIGHNPTIYELAIRLAAQGSDTLLNHLSMGYAPATLSHIETDIESWADIAPDRCRLTALLDPVEYSAA